MSQPAAEVALPILRTVAALRQQVKAWHAQGFKVAIVPTMGALHEGHLSLVELAQTKADRVITTVFVNPKQFAPGEDFDAYPRDESADAAKLQNIGTNALYAPEISAMYPQGFQTSVKVSGLSEGLCTTQRPHFFEGVATVVSKLLIQSMADVAVFGKKDYQQFCIIKKLAQDLDIPVEIVGAPVVRDAEGLALSSRNAYLSNAELKTAQQLNKIMHQTLKNMQNEAATPALENGKKQLLNAGFDHIDYLEVRHAETLEIVDKWAPNVRIFAAAKIGKTRLIDNMSLEGDV